MTQPPVDIARGIFGLPEAELPHGGVSRTAVWPVIESAPGRRLGSAITAIRRQLAWWSMRRHAATMVELELVNPPSWARSNIARRRAAASLAPATTR